MVMVSLCFQIVFFIGNCCQVYNFMTKLVLCWGGICKYRGGIGYLLRKNIGMSTTPVPLHVYQHSIDKLLINAIHSVKSTVLSM